tara:strand:+ start:9267 stop:10742 length:1476 start_codon:yes stop_codon:yes gene_type:complete
MATIKFYGEGLLDHQRSHAVSLIRAVMNNDRVVDTSDTGTGKTYVACWVARELDLDLTVICTKAGIGAWKKAAALIGCRLHTVVNYEKVRTGNHPLFSREDRGKSTSFVFNGAYDSTLVVFDEAHKCKGSSTLNAKLMDAVTKSKTKGIACSATLAMDPTQMRAVGWFIGLYDKKKDFWFWAHNNGCAKNPVWGNLEFTTNKKKRDMFLTKLHSIMYPKRGARMLVDNIPEFPKNNIFADSYDVPKGAQLKRIYNQMQKDLDGLNEHKKEVTERAMERDREAHKLECERAGAVYDEESFNEMWKPSPLSILSHAREEAELLKVPVLLDLIQNARGEGKSVVVFVHFRATLEALRQKLKKESPSMIYGGQTVEERDNEVNRFQENKTRVILTQIRAGGESIDLDDQHGGFPRVSFISPGYSAVELVQAVGRICRSNTKSYVAQYLVFAKGCVEEEACAAVESKLANLKLLNDGDLTAGIQLQKEDEQTLLAL